MNDRVWITRKDRLLAEIDSYNADIVCLQELTANTFRKDFEPHMSARGYQCGFKLKFNRDSLPMMIDKDMLLAPGLFIRTSRFNVLELRTMLISSYLPEVERYLCTDLPQRFRDEIEEKNNAMQLCLVKDNEDPSDKFIVVVNAHLHWDPNDMDIKAVQTLTLQVAVDLFLREKKIDRDQASILICGDFNSMEVHQPQFCVHATEEQSAHTEHGGVFQLMSTGKLPHNHPEHPASFKRVHRVPTFTSPIGSFTPADHASETTRYAATTKTDTFTGRIDFIFVDDHIAVTQVLQLPFTDDTLADFKPVPTRKWPSDHLAIGAVVAVRH
jgi:CCR4-NOT transcription complex subunit 6